MKYLSKSYIDLMQLGATYSNIWRRIWFLDQRVPTFRRACNEEQETSSKKHWVERNRQQAYLNTRIHQWRSYSKNSFWNFSGILEWSVSIDLVKIANNFSKKVKKSHQIDFYRGEDSQIIPFRTFSSQEKTKIASSFHQQDGKTVSD